MQRPFANPIRFINPDTGSSVVLADTSSAVRFLSVRWRWDQGVDFFAAARACMRVMDEFDDPENARAAIVQALRTAQISIQ